MKVTETGEAISRDQDEQPRPRRRPPTDLFRAARPPRSKFNSGPEATSIVGRKRLARPTDIA